MTDAPPPPLPSPPPLNAEELVETLHGQPVSDPFRWLEPGDAPEVVAWQDAWTAISTARLAALPARAWLAEQLQRLWRYDDMTPDRPALRSPRRWYSTKRADQDKWALWLREGPGQPGRLILDPNTFARTETLASTVSSPDCRYLVYGIANGGDENPILRVMDLDTGHTLDDRVTGWKCWPLAWRHDNSGFYYMARPNPGEVPPGEEHYWHRVYFHPLGTDGSADRIVFQDTKVKEHFHSALLSDDGRWLTLLRTRFHQVEFYQALVSDDSIQVAGATGLDADYHPNMVADRLLVMTDWGAPRYRLMSAPVAEPQREGWVEIIAEHPRDTMTDVTPAGGRLYVTWQRAATTRITVHALDGTLSHELELPGLGTASVHGHWDQDEVRISYQSFATPPLELRYDAERRALTEIHRSPVPMDTSDLTVEQVWYTSADGTGVPMFLVSRADTPRDGRRPTWLTGYGGFNISRTPGFSVAYALWAQRGGVVAIPNLRGGGEFGASWHEAGMREHKQNVFDDFIAAAEWLIANGVTDRQHLGISGGSNGGLLVSAALVQRPDLFRAVLCQVPLTDMLRFHRFGLANIWTLEYGSPDDPEMFPHIRAYSPYHNVADGIDAPAVLVTGSANDARTDPVHARKMFARLIQATGRTPEDPRPILLKVLADSGHHGGVTIDDLVAQNADHVGFLMDQLGLTVPPDAADA